MEKNNYKNLEIMKSIRSIGIETDRDNANVGNNFSAKLLRIASEANKWHILEYLPEKLRKAHESGELYFHDLDSYNLTINCLNVETGKILKNGFNTGYGTLNSPKRIGSAAELSCILLQSTQNDMFGGQAHVNFDNDMGYFVGLTRDEIYIEVKEAIVELGVHISEEALKEKVEKKVKREVEQAMQGVVYNLNTMHARAGSQVPFSSLNIGLPEDDDAAMVCEVFLKEYEKGLGKGEQPIFPNIIFRVKEGVNREEHDKYHYLFDLACRVAAKRMNPMFMNLDADFNLEKYNEGIIASTMGCRTYIMSNINGEDGPGGRGNIAPTTVNLPRIALEADGDVDRFYEILRDRMELARESLLHRYSVLKELKVKDIPFIAKENIIKGAEGLGENDSIEPILKQGTFAVGFIGLAETLSALRGENHGQSEEAKDLGLNIIKRMRAICDEFKERDILNWSCYATPAEGLSGKFIKYDKERFGIVKGVTDKEYYTNSYHVPVAEKVSIKEKIDTEAPYHKLCNAGHITYIELDGNPKSEDVKGIINYAYKNTNINYMGINFHIRYCKKCGSDVSHGAEACKECGSREIQGISRVTGYLSLDERFGEGKTAERSDRIAHGKF